MSQQEIREALDLELSSPPPGVRSRILATVPHDASRGRDYRWLALVATIVMGLLVIAVLTGTRLMGPAKEAPATGMKSVAPPASRVSAGAYDSGRHSLVVLVAASATGKGVPAVSTTWTFVDGHWTRVAQSVAPPWRQVTVAAYDSSRSQSVFVMGTVDPGNQQQPETWTWDGASWQLRADAQTPAIGLNEAAMTDDPADHALILVVISRLGGERQTWRWDGNRWAQLSPKHSPEIAVGTLALGFDGRQVIAVGPANHIEQGAYKSETWAWSGTDWVRLHPATELPLGIQPGLAFDGRQAIASVWPEWGGDQQTWAWDGTTWSRLHPQTSPPGRSNPQIGYDPALHRVILFGGGFGQYTESDLWSWNGSNWRLLAAGSPVSAPPPGAKATRSREMNPDQVAPYLRSAVTASSPILVPGSVPAGMRASVFAPATGYTLHYFNDDSTKWFTLTVAGSPNGLPPFGPPAVTTTRPFRRTEADYVVYDPATPITGRILYWTEPGSSGGASTVGGTGVPFLFEGEGLTQAEFDQITASLTAFPTAADARSATPSPASAQTCGSWSGASSPTGSALTARYGAIRNCLLVNNVWIITTAGSNGGPGGVGEYDCGAVRGCLDGAMDHPAAGWVFHAAPYPGSVTVLQVSGDQVIVSNGGHQLAYTTGAGTFSGGTG